MVYARPRTLREAVAALAGREALILAGGTDIFPAHVGRALPGNIIDVSNLAELRGISEERDHYRIGGATRWTDILREPLPPAFDCLKLAAREVGSIQIQNRGTVAGNLCNASPAADGIPPLLALDAEIELTSLDNVRRMPLAAFITGYRKTALAQGELLSAVLVPKSFGEARSSFFKLGARRYLVISIVMVAAIVRRGEGGRIADARIAIGAASAVAQRLTELEHDLKNLAADVRPSSIIAKRHIAGLSPIDDVRATAAYRGDAALRIIGEALDRAGGSAFH
ncbi:MAG: FAD binding domain-containing protein [Rhizobiales bacterium]|nr:FAD binding domain-containing protein [Hyphomicrobiales bacterium]